MFIENKILQKGFTVQTSLEMAHADKKVYERKTKVLHWKCGILVNEVQAVKQTMCTSRIEVVVYCVGGVGDVAGKVVRSQEAKSRVLSRQARFFETGVVCIIW